MVVGDTSTRKSVVKTLIIALCSLCYLQPVQCLALPQVFEKITFMSLNVWSGLDYEGTIKMGFYELEMERQRRYKALVKEITNRSPDVIAINEANMLPGYIQQLAKDIGYDFIYHIGISGVRLFGVGFPLNLSEGDALLARKGFSLEKVGRKQLSGGPVYNFGSINFGDAAQVLVGKINNGDKDIYLAVTHLHASVPDITQYRDLAWQYRQELGSSEKQYQAALRKMKEHSARRMTEAKKLVAYLEKTVPKGAPLLLMGDFNAAPNWPTMKYLTINGYRDVFSGLPGKPSYTWDGTLNENIRKYYDNGEDSVDLLQNLEKHLNLSRIRIDFILVNDMVSKENVVESQVCANTKYNGVYPSDHFGICATLYMN